MFLCRKKTNQKKKTIKDLTPLLKWKEGIINTIAITNIACVTDLSVHNYN